MEGIHPSAIVDPSAKLGGRISVGPYAIVAAGVVLGEDCMIEPFAKVGPNVHVGTAVHIGQGAALGGWPQITGFAPEHLGGCRIGDRCRIGEYATVHAASDPQRETVVEGEAFLMAYSHVAHDCRVGERAILANAVQLGGFVDVGRGAFLGGACAIHQGCLVGEYAFVAGEIPIDRDVPPWSRVLGLPAAWARLNLVGLRRAGWSREEILEAGRLLSIVLRQECTLTQAADRIRARPGELARRLTDFLRRSRRGLVRPRN
jgi:UDP-N-acetylglucosamine acyltransferase